MSNTCKKQKTIYNKQKNTPQYIAVDCYGSVMLGTNKKPYISVEKNNRYFDVEWKPYKNYKKYNVVGIPDKATDKCNLWKYKPGGWKNDLLSPPYDPLDCKGLKLIGNDGNLWLSKTVGKSFDAPAYWNLVHQKDIKQNVKSKHQKIIKSKKKRRKTNKVKSSKVNKRLGRPSPSVSATLFNVGIKKKGGDGNMWIIVENKNGVKRWKRV